MRIAICIEDQEGDVLDADSAIMPMEWDEQGQTIAADWMEHAIVHVAKEYAAQTGYILPPVEELELDWDRDGPTIVLQDSNSDDTVTIYGYIDGQ